MNMTVLVVDDQKNMCWILSKILSDEGFSVKTANSVKDALSIVNDGKVSAAIIDLRLPDGNGFDLFLELRKRDKALPCILITSYGSSDFQKQALKLGFDAYLDKPFDNYTLVAILKEITKTLGNSLPKKFGK